MPATKAVRKRDGGGRSFPRCGATASPHARAGLGTVWTTLHLPYEREVGDALGIPDTVTQLACIPTAYYTGDDFKPATRKPAESVTYWNGWKQTDIAS